MEIDSISHGGLKRFLLKDDARPLGGKGSELCKKLQKILQYILEIKHIEELFKPILKWKAHYLSDNRISLWVTGNWRLTFSVTNDKIQHLNLEDYH